MNKELKKIADEAGFVFWGREPYGPGPDKIDWSCNYDEAIENFARILIERTKNEKLKHVV
jgi:hypothetical protein